MYGRRYLRARLRDGALSAGRRVLVFLTILGLAAMVFGFAYIFVARATPGLEIAPGLLGAIIGAILTFVLNLILAVQRSSEQGKANEAQSELAQRVEEERQQRELEITSSLTDAAAIRQYLSNMSGLMLDHRLREAPENSDVRRLARAWTEILFQGSSSDGKGSILLLLYDLNLISQRNPLINVRGADLQSTRLRDMNLPGLDLRGADLSYADLRHTDLSEAQLRDTNLSYADLSEANLSGVVGWTEDQLTAARSLEGATMPNGQKYEDWLKDKKAREEEE